MVNYISIVLFYSSLIILFILLVDKKKEAGAKVLFFVGAFWLKIYLAGFMYWNAIAALGENTFSIYDASGYYERLIRKLLAGSSFYTRS